VSGFPAALTFLCRGCHRVDVKRPPFLQREGMAAWDVYSSTAHAVMAKSQDDTHLPWLPSFNVSSHIT